MIQIITGVPGGGKTYNAVSKMLKLLDDGQIVVHNIHGFTDSRAVEWDFGQIPLDAESLFKAFDLLRVQRGVDPETIITVFIDEAQRYWPYEYKDSRGVFFFDYHRHHGLDIFLITQDIKKISPKISTLAEMEIRAIKPMFQLAPGFMYNQISGGEIFGKERLSKRPEVFQAYTSFLAGKGSQKKSKYRWAIPLMVSFTIIMYFVLSYALKNSFSSLSPQNSTGPIKSLKSDSIASTPPKSDYQSKNEIGAGVTTDDDFNADVKYLAPSIISHRANYISYNSTDSGFVVEILFSDFIEKYPPDIYGYSYFISPTKNKLVIMDRYAKNVIYPVGNAVARTKNYIKNEPDKFASGPSPDDVLSVYPSSPVGHGYSSEDKKLLLYFKQVAQGFNPSKPSESKKVQTNQIPVNYSGNSTIIQP